AHKAVPDGWRTTVRGWADVLKQGLSAQRSAQEEFDKAFGEVVKQQVFSGSAHFKGRQYAEFVTLVADLVKRLRLAKEKAEDRAEVERLMKQDRELNATECKEYKEYMDATSATKNREAALKHARGCGASQCYDKRLEAARGPCSATGVREAQLEVARLSFAREEARQFQEMLLKNKGNSAEDRAKIEKRIAELSRGSQEELDQAKFLAQCESNTHPEQKKLDEESSNVCAGKGPECKKHTEEWDEFQKDQDRRIKEQVKRDRKREARRRKIGLKPDSTYRDCD
ncbi:MAG TPA: hypothetical protein P5076_24520, partial [Myxococcota bacterium]|nr:hypothetical protein [Myxococcota bacterium]